MEKKGILFILFCALCVISFFKQVHAQEWDGSYNSSFWNHWSVNLNAGLTSYFGDLSYYDYDISNKLSKESGAAYGVILTKHISEKIGISGQLLFGNLKGGKDQMHSFTSKLYEYNIQARVNFLKLIFPFHKTRFGFNGYAGFGQMLFKITSYSYDDDTPNSDIHKSQVPEFVYFAGGGISYRIIENVDITADLSARRVYNDKLDNYVKSNDYDYYSYISIGITYHINNTFRLPEKSKSRIAHTGIRRR